MFGPFFHTILIEQVFGLYLLIMAIIFLSRAKYYRELARNINVSGSVFLASSIELMLGLFLVIIHNFWVWEPRLVVTVICWVVLVRAIIWLAFPEAMVERTKKLAAGPWYYVVSVAMAALGVYLMTTGFYPHMHM
jgi:hypothetical protein